MRIDGTATISLTDYEKLKKAAKRGIELTNIHEELLTNTGLLLTAIAQDTEFDKKVAHKIMERVKVYARSTKSISFYSDEGNIILKRADEKEESDD